MMGIMALTEESFVRVLVQWGPKEMVFQLIRCPHYSLPLLLHKPYWSVTSVVVLCIVFLDNLISV